MEILPGPVLWSLFLLHCCIGGKKSVHYFLCIGDLLKFGGGGRVSKSYHQGQETTFWPGLAHPPLLLPHSLFSLPPDHLSVFHWAASINTQLS